METPLQRMELLIGENNLEILKRSTVMVVGVGGVGSYAAEALARSGVGTLILVDGDTVAPSNLNRQIHAVYATIGRSKTEVMKERMESYRRDCTIICKDIFYKEEENAVLFDKPVDFVIDAIDTMSSKLSLITYCLKHKIPFISSMGMANRLDPTKVECCELMNTSYDPVAFSSEQPSVQTKIINENGVTRKQKMPPASSPFVPSAAGLAAASYAMRILLEKGEHHGQ